VLPIPGVLAGDALTYPGALPSTNLVYTAEPGGYKEEVVLLSALASGKVSWAVHAAGYALEQTPDGSIGVLDSDKAIVFEMPAPFVYDSAGEISSAPATLQDLGGGNYLITVEADPEFLSKATYPVTIDPGTTQPAFLYDTHANSAAPTTAHGSVNPLNTGPWTGSGTKYRMFMRFGTAWQDPDKVIYSAELHLKNTSEPSASTPVEIDRATWDWSNALTWNSMMSQPGEGVSATPAVPDQHGPTNGWWTIELKKLYQPIVENVYLDRGFRLVSSDNKKFNSENASGTANDPYLVVSFNTLPNAPQVDGPTGTPVFESKSGVSLRLQNVPPDPDGDEVLVRYQVTNVQGNWGCSQNGDYCSAWTNEDTFNVPAAWLTDGGTFYWRVQSADVCIQPSTLCSNTRPDGTEKPWKTTLEHSFVISLKNRGVDDRYAMWAQSIGNGMRLLVNEANGNLVAQVPLTSVRTPLGRLRVALSYNSQTAAEGTDRGVGPGWRLWAGPESSGLKVPIEVDKLTPSPYAGLKVTFASGAATTFPWRAGRTYGELGLAEGVITENPNGTFVYRGPDGDVYSFNANGRLTKARTVSTKPKTALAANPNYSYTFNTNNHLTSITDPLNRTVAFDWQMVSGTERLKFIDTWSLDHWALYYNGDGSLERITNPEGEHVEFDYAAVGGTSVKLLSEVRDGYQKIQHDANASKHGWRIEHFHDTVPVTAYQMQRVRKIAPPGADFNQHYWLFTYGSAPGDYVGTTSKTTRITDPRGVGQTTNWTTVVDFNNAGSPIRVIAPKKPGETTDWTTRTVWDTNNQIVCTRSAPANARNGTGCTAGDTTSLQNTVWTYDNEAPYRLEKIQHPAPPSTTRIEQTFTYDEGGTFDGLWSERFENADLSGVPSDERRMSDLAQDWGTGAPPEIDDPNTWSLRLSGLLFVDPGETYEFKISGDDGYSLVIDNTVLLDCLYATDPGVNCGAANPPKKKFWDLDHHITIEYRDQSSTTAHLKLWWRKTPSQTWLVPPASALSPDLGLLTQQVSGPAGGGPLTRTTTWTFPNEDFKTTRLPDVRTVTGQTGGQRKTNFDYDDWGRKSVVTRFFSAPSNEQATSTFTYTDNSTKSCLTRVDRPEGRVRRFNCNADGERISKTVEVRPVTIGGTTIQPQQNRTWDYTLDDVGRILRVDLPGTGLGATQISYDSSGRPVSSWVLVRGTGSLGTDWAKTIFSYNDWPGLSSFHTMTETYPDPDPFSSLVDAATETHTYDWAGNETSRTDVRNPALLWLTGYDAQNRVISTTSPDPDGGGSLLPLTTSTTYTLTSGEYSVTATDPADVQSKTWMDVLGRSDQTQSGSTVPTWFAYDPVGNVTRVQVADGPGPSASIITWRENDYDAFGQPTALREPAMVNGSPVTGTTTYTYHVHTGRLLKVDGPLDPVGNPPQIPPQKDVVEYTWDTVGRLTTSKIWTTPSTDYLTTITYDDADEQVRIASELSADSTKVQIRDFSYTFEGQLDVTTERHGAGLGNVVFDNDYDLVGRLTSIDSPRWPQSDELVFVYDDLGQETARYRDTGSGQADRIDTTYEADGLVKTTSRSGTTYTYAYDSLGRPTSLVGGGNTTSWAYYGDSFEASQRGWLKQLTTPAGATSYLYYEVGEPGGSPGQLEALTDPLSGGQTEYVYDEAGRVIYRTDPGGLTWWREYESQTGRIDTQEISNIGTPHKTYAWFDLDYDEAGDVKSRVEKLWRLGTTTSPATTPGDAGTGSWTYDYDSAGRMLGAQGPNSSGTQTTWSYAYDGQGNRLTEQIGAVTDTYVTDDQGWPKTMDSSATGPGTDVTYGFDPDGDLTAVDAPGSADDLTFAYDSWGDTDAATAGGVSIDYALDAFGRTTQRTQGASVQDLAYAGGSENLATTVASGVTTKYAYSPSGPLAAKEGSSTTEFYLRDLHGDVVGTMPSGSTSLADTLWYSPFGDQSTLAGSATSMGYQGDWTDPSTGTVDMFTRNYLPSLGRFTSRDILGGDPTDPPSLNQYVYTSGSPISYSDPTGLVKTTGDGVSGPIPSPGPDPCHHDPECSTPDPEGDSGGAQEFPPPGSADPPKEGSRAQDFFDSCMSSGRKFGACVFGAERWSQVDCLEAHSCPGIEQVDWLTVCGFVAEPCDLASAGRSAFNGDFGGVAWSSVALIPWLGSFLRQWFKRIPQGAPTVAGRAARFSVDAAGNATVLVRAGNQSLELIEHAARRMSERHVSLEAVENTLSLSPFPYYHDGVWKMGYYDSKSKIFVGTLGNEVKTVIDNVSANYIRNLKAARP